MGDVGDGDPDDVAAGVGGVSVGLGIDGVVVVAGVDGVDGDEGEVAEVFAALRGGGLGGVGLGDHGVGEVVGDAVLVDRDEGDGLGGGGITQSIQYLGLRQAEAAAAGLLGLDQLAVAGVQGVIAPDAPVLVLALVDGNDAAALSLFPENPQYFLGVGAELADQAGLVVGIAALDLGQAGEDAVALGHGRIGFGGAIQDLGGRPLPLPIHGGGPLVALAVGGEDDQQRDGREFRGIAVAVAALLQRALGLELFQKPFEFNALIALDAKGLCDVALGREAGILGDPVQEVGLGGKRGHAPSGSMDRGQGHGKAVQRVYGKRRVSVQPPYVDRKSRTCEHQSSQSSSKLRPLKLTVP